MTLSLSLSLLVRGGSGWRRLPFQVISARRGGAAADAVVGAGEPIGRQSPLGVGVAASGAHAEKRVAGWGNGPRNRGTERGGRGHATKSPKTAAG